MNDLKNKFNVLENKLSELLNKISMDESRVKKVAPFSEEVISDLADELDVTIILLEMNGNLKLYNSEFKKYFMPKSETLNINSILDRISKNEQFFEFEKNVNLFKIEKYLEKFTFDLQFNFENKNLNKFKVKIKKIKNNKTSNLLVLLSKIDEKIDKIVPRTGHLFFNEIELLEQKAENLLEYNKNLKKSKNELKKINSKKDKFFNIIAHDLRAPFNSILGLTQILQNEAEELLPEEINDLASRIHDNSKNVLNMIEDLLNWARVQSNHMDFDPQFFNISDVVLDSIYLLNQLALSKGIKLQSKIDEELLVYGDKNMIYMVLRNFISNAVKFTENGGTIFIECNEVDEKLMISVRDNGVGIKKENINKILAMDEHYTKLGTNKEKGTGLGLVLCREFLHKNHSELEIKSEYGKGSIFSFYLPFKREMHYSL